MRADHKWPGRDLTSGPGKTLTVSSSSQKGSRRSDRRTCIRETPTLKTDDTRGEHVKRRNKRIGWTREGINVENFGGNLEVRLGNERMILKWKWCQAMATRELAPEVHAAPGDYGGRSDR